jgi:hypothetical protein
VISETTPEGRVHASMYFLTLLLVVRSGTREPPARAAPDSVALARTTGLPATPSLPMAPSRSCGAWVRVADCSSRGPPPWRPVLAAAWLPLSRRSLSRFPAHYDYPVERLDSLSRFPVHYISPVNLERQLVLVRGTRTWRAPPVQYCRGEGGYRSHALDHHEKYGARSCANCQVSGAARIRAAHQAIAFR